jgi:prepilin-type N-terminal cleavage/methylation domain-containing protein
LKVVVVKVLRRKSGFTLIELLVVIAILGILAGLAVPALKNLGKSDATVSASRQLLDDVGRARQLAMAQRTTVCMVFVPASFWTIPGPVPGSAWWSSLNSYAQNAVTNLCDEQLTGYTFIGRGTVGDQPGNHQWHYLAPWQSLPEGTFIATNKFGTPNLQVFPTITINGSQLPPILGFLTNAVPFPLETNLQQLVMMPCIIFDSFGHLVDQNGNILTRHEYIPLAKGSVMPGFNPATRTYLLGPPSVSEFPPGNSTNSSANIVDIDPLTGRAVLQFFKVQ